MKIIAIGGVPTSGKTTLVRAMMQRIPGDRFDFKEGTVRGSKFAGNGEDPWFIVLGVYDNVGIFEGTDKLSMSVQPHVERFVRGCDNDLVIIFEGDRLFNRKFLSFCDDFAGKSNVLKIVLSAPGTYDARHEARGDTQSDTFLRGRDTKIKNIVAAFPECKTLNHTTPDDTTAHVDYMLTWSGVKEYT